MSLITSLATVQAAAEALQADIATLSAATPSTLGAVVAKVQADSAQLKSAMAGLSGLVQQVATTFSGNPVTTGGGKEVDIGVP